MKRILLATVGLTALGITTSAVAADLPRAMPVKAPVAVPYFSWTGCYLGGHAGVGWAKTSWTNTLNTTAFGDMVPGQGFSDTDAGFIGGGQIGCNYQMGQWVFGLEGTLSGSTIKGTLTNTVFGAADDVFEHKLDALATITGRIGYAWDHWLLYAKGGWAGGHVGFSVSDTVGGNQGAGSASSWHSGWTLGAGVEYAMTANWIVGLEYDYISLNAKSYNVGGAGGSYVFDVKPRDIHAVLARVSYKFGGPVVARY